MRDAGTMRDAETTRAPRRMVPAVKVWVRGSSGVGERLVADFVNQRLGEVPAGAATGADAERLGKLVDVLDTRGRRLANLAVLDGSA